MNVDVEELLVLSDSDDLSDRRAATKELCTCRLRADDDRVWDRLLLLFHDRDARVRRDALHSITDSTPATKIEAVVAALESRYHDPDDRLRRRIRKTLNHYRRTGTITDAPR